MNDNKITVTVNNTGNIDFQSYLESISSNPASPLSAFKSIEATVNTGDMIAISATVTVKSAYMARWFNNSYAKDGHTRRIWRGKFLPALCIKRP